MEAPDSVSNRDGANAPKAVTLTDTRNPLLSFGLDDSIDVKDSMDQLLAVMAFLQDCAARRPEELPTAQEVEGHWLVNEAIKSTLAQIAGAIEPRSSHCG